MTSNSTWIDYVNQMSVQLHPRLMEYVNKKKYYKNINFEPSVSLEKQYNITKQDIDDIKSFYRGEIINDHNINDNMKYDKNFPSSQYWDKSKIPYKYPNKYPQPPNMNMFAGEKSYNDELNSYRDWKGCKINNRNEKPLDARDFAMVRSSFVQKQDTPCFETQDPDVLFTDSKTRLGNKSIGYRAVGDYHFDPGFYYDNQVEQWDVAGINTRIFNKSNKKIYNQNRDITL